MGVTLTAIMSPTKYDKLVYFFAGKSIAIPAVLKRAVQQL